MSELIPFLGRFHVLVLHLPIGLLTFALLQELWFALRKSSARPALANGIWLAGLASAVAACALGWLLAEPGDYDATAVAPHLWWGLGVAAAALVCWLAFVPLQRRGLVWALPLGGIQALTLVMAGHQGGGLTHGPDYLTEKAPPVVRRVIGLPPAAVAAPRPPPARADATDLFADFVHPILDRNCVTCHRPGKTKGGLRLDDHAQIFLGGDSGLAVVPGRPGESEMIRRITLPHDHDDFMPGGGKKPLTSDAIALLRWWIETGAAPAIRVADLKPDATIRALLNRAQGELTAIQVASVDSGTAHSPESDAELADEAFDLPAISAIAPAVRTRLERMGFDVKQLSQDNAYLDIDYFPLNRQPVPVETLRTLREVGAHVVWLNLAGAGLTDEQLDFLGALPNLKRLNLTSNPVTTAGLAALPTFAHLTSLNLTNTQVDDGVWSFLDRQPRLQRAYLWGTKATPPGPRPYLATPSSP